MNLFTAFSKKAPNRVFIAIVLGAFAGVCYSLMIPLVMSSISPEDPLFASADGKVTSIASIDVADYKLAGLYLVTCLLILFMRSASEIMLVRVASEVAKDYRTVFYQRIADAPLAVLEQIGSSKFVASINLDVPRIISGARALPDLLINTITLLGMLAFLMYLNIDVFKLVMIAILVGVVCYQVPMTIGSQILRRSRESQDDLQEAMKGLLYGSKELKLDSDKRHAFFQNVLMLHENSILKNDKKAQTIIRATISFGDLISFFVIGSVSFIFVNYYAITAQELVGVVMALLYVTGPIAVLLGAIPSLAVALISYRKLNRLLARIPKEEVNPQVCEMPNWQSLQFNQVKYAYPSDDDEPGFEVGPLSFALNKGEITFIVGANGSGKSTISKLLTLHYTPTGGEICFSGNPVNNDTITSYRQSICAIYTDYYLFDRLLINVDGEVLTKAQNYLEKFHLADKVTINDGHFSTLSLSDGQRKRLALLVSFLEDKQFYLFDEWAADQDPLFKNIFYTEILPELKAKGKIVVVISHDDRFFHLADKVLTMEQGQLVTPQEARTDAEQGANAQLSSRDAVSTE